MGANTLLISFVDDNDYDNNDNNNNDNNNNSNKNNNTKTSTNTNTNNNNNNSNNNNNDNNNYNDNKLHKEWRCFFSQSDALYCLIFLFCMCQLYTCRLSTNANMF